MDNIESIVDIQVLVRNNPQRNWTQYGEVSVKEDDDLLIFNYTHAAQYEARWNYFERVSRGLIINSKTGEVVARAFDKFFNWGEGDRTSTGKIVSVTQKMDGSLGIMYRRDGGYKIATRGSFDSEQAVWATEFLSRLDVVNLDESFTLLFEIVYPENRIVVDYGDMKELVLLAVRNRFTGMYLSQDWVEEIANEHEFGRARRTYGIREAAELIERKSGLTINDEGWVLEYDDGQRFKIKGDRYVELHRLISTLSFKNTLAAVVSGSISKLFEIVPDEFLGEVVDWVDEIKDTVHDIKIEAVRVFEDTPKDNRKDFALHVREHHAALAPYLFSMLDGRDLEPLVYKMAFKDRDANGKPNAP